VWVAPLIFWGMRGVIGGELGSDSESKKPDYGAGESRVPRS